MRRFAFYVSFICLTFSLPVTADDRQYESPAAVYSALQTYIAFKDYDGVCKCLTPDSLELWAWFAAIMSGANKEQSAQEPPESGVTRESIEAVLVAHGLSEHQVKRAFFSAIGKPQREVRQIFKNLLNNVKHKPRFVADMYLEISKMKTTPRTVDPLLLLPRARSDFIDLQIDGDQATAIVPNPEGAKKKTQTLHFRKSRQGWRVHIPSDLPTSTQSFKSPADVYAAAQSAVRKKDYGTLCNCLTGDSLEMWAWMTAIFSQSARQQLEEDGDKSIGVTPTSIDRILSAHSLSTQKIKRAVFLSLAKPENERGKVFSDALKGVKHKPRFVVDVYLEIRKMKTDLSRADPMLIFGFIRPDFYDLVVNGDQATAQVNQLIGDKKKVRTIQFRREGNGWLIYFPMDFRD